MALFSIGRKIRRYRAVHPYSYRALFFFLDSIFTIGKVALVCGLFVGPWLAFDWWLKQKSVSTSDNIPVVTGQTDTEQTDSTPSDPELSVEELVTKEPASNDQAAQFETGFPNQLQQKPFPPADDSPVVNPPREPLDVAATQSTPKELTETELSNEAWVLGQERDRFTIQLGSSVQRDKLVEFAKELAIESNAHIFAFRVTRAGNPLYGIATGLYPDLPAARVAITGFPESYRQFDPWVRPIGELHDEINLVKQQLNTQ